MDTEDGGGHCVCVCVCVSWRRGGGGGAVEGGDNNNGSWAVLSAKSTVTANLNSPFCRSICAQAQPITVSLSHFPNTLRW